MEKEHFFQQLPKNIYVTNGLHQSENPFPQPRMEYLLTFSLYRKMAYLSKKTEENCFHQQKNVFRLKVVPPNFNNCAQQQEKALNKSMLFTQDRINFRSLEKFGEKGFGGICIQQMKKLLPVAVVSENIGGNSFQ